MLAEYGTGCSFGDVPQVSKTESSSTIYRQHSHSFKVLFSTSHTHFQSSAQRSKHFDSGMETMHGTLNLLLLQGPEL